MATRDVTPSKARRKRFALPIGLRLLLAFQVVILLTGLIGFLAMQEFSNLTKTTTELNTHDLPEVLILSHMRTQLFEEKDLEWSLVFSDNPGILHSRPPVTLPPTPSTSSSPGESSDSQDTQNAQNGNMATSATLLAAMSVASSGNVTHYNALPAAFPGTVTSSEPTQQQMLTGLKTVLQTLASLRATLLTFEPPDSSASKVIDTKLVHTLTNGVVQAAHTSIQLQDMVKQQQFTAAQSLQNQQQQPLLVHMLAITSQLRTLEQQEVANVAGQVQQQSSQSSMIVLGLTAFALLLSLLLALIMTRSLTRPLSQLLVATKVIATGNLNQETRMTRRDEIGQLAESFNAMRLNLRSTIEMLELEQRRTQAVIDASVDGVILVDAALRVLQCNPSVELMSGWSANEAKGKRWCELFTVEPLFDEDDAIHGTACSLCHALHQIDQVNQSFTELQVKVRNGQQRWFAVSSSPLVGDKERFQEQWRVINIHDITQLKALEQMKTDFVAMVSHELRAPVTTVTGAVEMLDMLDPKSDQEAYHEVLGILGQQTRRLRNVVQEVLQLTRFEAGRLPVTLQPLPLIAFLQDVVSQVQQEWAGKRRVLTFTPQIKETLVWADRNMLEIIVRNLLDNAYKYTPTEAPIELSLLPSEKNDQVQVRVDDYGPGIPEEQQEMIFERFSRGRHTSMNWHRGYGLGLYIVRELVRAHNGSIWVENHVKGGASFNVCLHIADQSFFVDEDETLEEIAQKELTT